VHPDCRLVPDFEFSLEKKELKISLGEDGKLIGTVKNTGDVDLILTSSITGECCNFSLPARFELAVKREEDFLISVHVPLTTRLGSYLATVKIYGEGIEMEKNFKILVVRGSTLEKLDKLIKRLHDLNVSINEYEKIGVDVSELWTMVLESNGLISDANQAIQEDDLPALKERVDELEAKVNLIELRLLGLRLQRFLLEYKYEILAAILAAFALSYLISQVALPYWHLHKEIAKMRQEIETGIETRKRTEKNYFLRKIDEQTFREIMIREEEKILHLRSEIRKSEEVLAGLIRAKLSPRAVLLWVMSWPKTLVRELKGLFRYPKKIYRFVKRKIKKFIKKTRSISHFHQHFPLIKSKS
jgi:hypothetical protein